MKDVVGNVLVIGDWVATTTTHYEELKIGRVKEFTPKMCRVFFDDCFNDYSFEQLKSSIQLVKLGYNPEEILL